jgi:hypothetical protein
MKILFFERILSISTKLMNDREKNRQTILNMLKDRKRHLNETDRRSLSRTIAGLTNFGNDFANFRRKKLADVPNTVITGLCQVLKDIGIPVYLPREADRYNDISTLCIQETWDSHLKYIFELTKFINMNHISGSSIQKESIKTSEAYLSALSLLDQNMFETSVALYLQQHETTNITHIAFVRSPTLSIVSAFAKRGSAHRLLAYSARNGDNIYFYDSREKNLEKKAKKEAATKISCSMPTAVLSKPATFQFIENSESSSPMETNTAQCNFPQKKIIFPSLATLMPCDPMLSVGANLSFLNMLTRN